MDNIIEGKQSSTSANDVVVLVSLFGMITLYKVSQYLVPKNFIVVWILFMVAYITIIKYLEFLGYYDEAKTLRNSIFFSIGARLMAT